MSVVVTISFPVTVCLKSGQCLGSAFVCEECISGEEIKESLVGDKELMITQVGFDKTETESRRKEKLSGLLEFGSECEVIMELVFKTYDVFAI